MEWIAALQKAINYMEEHLLEDINYETVARQVHISSYEFHRAFSFLSGMTANTYIRNRRLSLAGKELLEKDVKVTDIALKYGYDTPESFTKAFTRFHGVAPKYVREAGAKLTLFNPLVIRISMEGGRGMDYRIVEKKEQKFLALVRQFRSDGINDDDNHEIPDFWSECHGKNSVEPLRELKPVGKRDLYGLCSPTKAGEEYFDYGIGVLLDEETMDFDMQKMLDAGYCLWEVPAGTYVVLDCKGMDGDCIGEAWSWFYKQFLPQMSYEATDATDFEIYYENGEPGVFCELWIPVKKA